MSGMRQVQGLANFVQLPSDVHKRLCLAVSTRGNTGDCAREIRGQYGGNVGTDFEATMKVQT